MLRDDDEPKILFSAFAIIADKSGNVLAFIDKNPKSRFTCQHFKLPGGGVKKGETFQQAMRREVAEETGLKVAPGRRMWVSHVKVRGEAKKLLETHYKVFFIGRVEGVLAPLKPTGKNYTDLGLWSADVLLKGDNKLTYWHKGALQWFLGGAVNNCADEGLAEELTPQQLLSRPSLVTSYYGLDGRKYRRHA